MLLNGAYILSEKPIILGAGESMLPALNQAALAAKLPERPVVLSAIMWNKEPWSRVIKTRFQTSFVYRHLKVHWLGNSQREGSKLRIVGCKARHLHHNLFCLDTVFTIKPIEKKWDAIYNASLEPYKRVDLAAQVEKLRLVTRTPKQANLVKELGCDHAEINTSWLGRADLAEVLNQAWCALALSAEEGGMVALTEYLLCGLPVVTTPSKGGRDVWYTDYNHIVVEPKAEAVRDAVNYFKSNPRDPERIRRDCLHTMESFRQNYVSLVNSIAEHEAVTMDSLFKDEKAMLSKLVMERDFDELFKSYDGSQFQARNLVGTNSLNPR
jgi:glycosyltransferase involved in cell wall biosynthesis